MISLTLRRVAMAIPILFGVSVVIFLLMQVLPGDASSALVPEDATPAEAAGIRESLGLNDPLPVRYVNWLGDVLQGDLGHSLNRRQEVTTLIGQAWVNTAILAATSAAVGLLGGVALGMLAGIKRGRWPDRVVSFFSLTGLSIPSFFVAIIMLITFSAELGWLPTAGTGRENGLVSLAQHLVMPTIAGCLATLAVTSRVTRASIVETYGADFVQTLTAKGLRGPQILRHVLKNAISPVLTTSGLQVGNLLGGSVLIETIFRWPGIGTLVFGAISQRDLIVVQGATLVIALTFVLMNLVVDLLQATIDPRLRRAVT